MASTLIQLPVDNSTLQVVERVAAARKTTVEQMLLSALETISLMDFDESKLSPRTRIALGMAEGIPDRPYKELLVEALMQK